MRKSKEVFLLKVSVANITYYFKQGHCSYFYHREVKYLKYSMLILSTCMLSSCGGSDSGGTDVSGGTTTPTTVSISANPMTVMVEESTTITWSSTDASSCTASGAWSGDKSLAGSGSLVMNHFGEHSFKLTCGTASSTITVTVNSDNSEGSCVNPHSAEIYESYLGDYEVPMPQNFFSDDKVKAIGLKDYGVEWVYNNYSDKATWIADCTEEQYIKLMYRTTLNRLKNHGVNTVSIYNFGYWQNAQAEAWLLDHDAKHLDDWVIEYIVAEAEKLDLNIHYVWQFLAVDTQSEFLFPFNGNVEVDMPLLKKIMDAHQTHILWEAERLETLRVGTISADWSAMWICFHCGIDENHSQEETDEVKDYYMERMGGIIDKIKEKFSGKVYVGDGPQWNDKRVFDKVDGIILPFGHLLTDDEVATATVDLIQERATQFIENTHKQWNCLDGQPCWYNSSETIPKVMFNFFGQSHTSFLSTGWIEDGFCTQGIIDGVTNDCVQYEVKTDFSAQAIFTEGLLRAADTQLYFDTLGTTTTTGYWLSDTLIPDTNQFPASSNTVEGFPNMSQSIRGKSAEKIIKYWYTGEYEAYAPKIIE
jgi:hypothetical protein